MTLNYWHTSRSIKKDLLAEKKKKRQDQYNTRQARKCKGRTCEEKRETRRLLEGEKADDNTAHERSPLTLTPESAKLLK